MMPMPDGGPARRAPYEFTDAENVTLKAAGKAPIEIQTFQADTDAFQQLALGRVGHALTGRRLLDYQRRIGSFVLPVHPPLVVAEVLGQCALSPRSAVTLAELNAAIQALVAQGDLARILGKYR